MKSKLAIVTGAGSGIGREVACLLAKAHHQVAALDINQQGLDDTSRLSGTDLIHNFYCDLADPESIRDVIATACSEFGSPVALCNIAALQIFGRSDEFALADWQRVMDINLRGTFLTCKEVLPLMEANGGNIVNIASLAGQSGLPYDAAYAASKGGVIALTKSLAKEYSATKISINALAPGAVDTPMLHIDHPTGIDPKVLSTIPKTAQKPANASDVAEMVVFLATRNLTGMTGSIVTMAGAAG